MITILSCSKKVLQKNTSSNVEDKITSKTEIKSTINTEIIIEGTVISEKRGFYQNTIFSSCVVEVNKIFKGEINEKVIEVFVTGGSLGDMWVSLSHGQISLPPKGSTAIFRIKELAKENYRQELIELSPFKLFYGTGEVRTIFPDSHYGYERINIEKEIYQKLESESGRKRSNLLDPATNDEVAIIYSTKNKLLLPNRKIGLVYKLTPVQESKKEDKMGFYVHMSSTNSVTYLQKGELIIEYNSKAFGDSIISNGKLEFEIPRNYQKGRSSWFNAIPEHFEVSLQDVSSNKFKIVWENSLGTDSCIQLLPKDRGIYSAVLYFSPLAKEEPINLKLIGVDSENLQYDYDKNQIIPYEYTAVQEIQYFQVQDLVPATVSNIIPKNKFQPLDTVIIKGKNFMRNSVVSICSKGENGRFGYKEIPKNYIINKNDSLITFRVPYSVFTEDCGELTQDCFSTKGSVKITKGYGQFEVMTWSKKSIEIKNTAPNKG